MGASGAAAQLAAVVRGINAAHRTSFTLVGRFGGGEQGAYRLRDAAGREWALKWSPQRGDLDALAANVGLIERLRAAGHRVPRVAAWGVRPDPPAGRYLVQEALPGTPPTSIDAGLLEQIFALNDLQAGLAAGIARPGASGERGWWPALPVQDVLAGGDGYCLIEPMQRYSPRTAALLAALQDFVAAHARRVARVVATEDIVHFDLHPANILVQGAQVTGIVDWDGACAGDRAFDLCTLLFYCHDPAYEVATAVQERLWERICALCGPAAAGVYLAHMAHRQVEWMVRHYPDAVQKWLSVTEAVLAEVAQRTAWP